MKNKNAISKVPANTKPISMNAVKGAQGTIHKASFLDRLKHGLSDAAHDVESHTIGEAAKLADDVKKKAESVATSVGHTISTAATKVSQGIKSGATDILHGAEAVESGLLPSGSSIIMETGLAVGGLAIVGLLAFKFL